MICRSCSEGTALYGDDPGGVMWKAFHDKCKGDTHCDCQHVPIPRVRRLGTLDAREQARMEGIKELMRIAADERREGLGG